MIQVVLRLSEKVPGLRQVLEFEVQNTSTFSVELENLWPVAFYRDEVKRLTPSPAGTRPQSWVAYVLQPGGKQVFKLDAVATAMGIYRDVQRPHSVWLCAFIGVKNNGLFVSSWIPFDASKVIENHEETDN